MILGTALIMLVSLSLFQTVYVLEYSRRIRRARDHTEDPGNCPPAAIVICLRGKDPSLSECLNSVFDQAYPCFQVVIVFDSEQDPAYEFVGKFIEMVPEHANKTKLVVMKEIQSKGSLKCQAICTALENLDETTEVIAFIDADCIVDENWLRDLVQPFSDESVGATTGNRFFQPKTPNLGSKLREVWNSAAIVQMSLYQIAWGGSFAIRRSILGQTDIVARWKTSFCEDTMLGSVLQSNGFKMQRAPELVVCNRESTKFRSAFRWIVRQLLTSRLYVRLWPLVVMHALFVGLAIGFSLFAAAWFGLRQEWHLFWQITAAIIVYEGINFGLLAWITRINCQILKRREGKVNRFPLLERTQPSTTVLIIAMLCSQVVQPLAALQAALTRVARWRGIEYSFEKDGVAVMKEYSPFVAHEESNSESSSIN